MAGDAHALDFASMDADEFAQFIETFDLFDPALQQPDLTDLFARTRDECPVVRTTSRAGDVWMLSRYSDLRHVMQHPEVFSNRVVVWPFEPSRHSVMLNDDGDEHRRYRQLLSPLFTPQRAAAVEPFIREAARSRAEAIRDAGRGEVVAQYARPIPAEVFLHTFGVDRDALPAMMEAAEAGFRLPDDQAGAQRAYEGSVTVSAYFRQEVRRRRKRTDPGDDIIGTLATVHVDGAPLDEDELVNLLGLLTSASLDTTASALANIMTWLVQHPTERDTLVADPTLLPGAIEELLRYYPMVWNGRLVTRDVELGGQLIRAGERVMMNFHAADRDPEEFSNPETVDFLRSPNRHLAFALGPHRCIGAHLARATLRVELEEWHRAIPRYSLARDAEPKHRLTMLTTFTELHVQVDEEP